jgi:hypothetical protein
MLQPSLTPTANIGIAAINLGFGYTKLSLDGVEETFMSVVSPHQKSISGIEDSRQNFLNIVRDEDESFEVGLKAAATSWTEPLRLMSSV